MKSEPLENLFARTEMTVEAAILAGTKPPKSDVLAAMLAVKPAYDVDLVIYEGIDIALTASSMTEVQAVVRAIREIIDARWRGFEHTFAQPVIEALAAWNEVDG